MNVFLTWSGKRSHAVAQALYEWIPSVLQRIKPFLSSEDIRKGSRWQSEIAAKLAEVQFAIVCLTADNLTAPWINFEAGAVSKHVQSGKVTALLVGVVPSDLQGPLVQFQHTSASREDIRRLMSELNDSLGPEALRGDHFADTFETYWPRLDVKLQAAQNDAGTPAPAPMRPMEEMVAEVLEINRNNGRAIASLVHVQQQLCEHILRLETPLPAIEFGGPLGNPHLRPLRRLKWPVKEEESEEKSNSDPNQENDSNGEK